MKKIRTRFLSAFLALLTLLTLLPTSALAASGSGTGIKPTTDPNLWSTRLTSTGQQYSYRPPTAAGKQLYCMDLGYSYRFGTASFLNSYTYKSATGTDSDTLWDSAVADTGLGEMDAITRENVKWMMTYITDYKGDIPGSLFMALQTYIWDHQSNKSAGGDTSGDIDAGGYANADTYETYLGYVNWLLAQKAKEDAEYQQQIEDYAAKGIIASVVEDENAKWAVYAKSSVKGRQSFFNYYAPRKLQVGKTPAPEEPDHPPAGDADITLKKVAAGTTRGLDGARFLIYRDGQIVGSDVTANGGIIEVNDVTKGLWSFVETEAPSGYCTDPTPISVYVDTTDGDKQYTVTAENYELPNMKIIKRDAMSGKPIAGTVFSLAFSLLCILLANPLLRLLQVPAEILPIAVNYLRIVFAGLLFTFFYNFLAATLRALGDSKSALYFLMISAVLNIGGDLFFVEALDWGSEGCALSTVLSEGMCCLLCALYIRWKVPVLQLGRRWFVFDGKLLRKTVSYGWVSAMQQATVQLGKIAVQAIVNTMGVSAMAAFTAASRIDDFAYTPQQNIGHAMTTFMAQNEGAGKKDRVKDGYRCGMRIEVVYALGLMAVCLIFAEPIIRLFVTDPEVVDLGVRFLRTISLFYLMPAATNGIQGFFRGIGDLRITLISSILNMAGRVAAASVLVLLWKMEIEALPYSYTFGWVLMLAYELPAMLRYLRKNKM